MVANAWYPIHYFRLSFGKSDSLFQIVMELQEAARIPIDASKEEVIAELTSQIDNKEIKKNLRILTINVPYRFLSPWISTSDDKEMVSRSQTKENGCLYSLHKNADDFFIEINPAWDSYLHSHYNILTDFTYWNLTQFLQLRNPNVPAISSKLIRPESRNSLAKQHRFWDEVITVGGAIRCIYTGQELHAKDYDLDHFMPWSFVAHDLIWNLIPSNGSINSSKSDCLPDMKLYLPKLAAIQQHSLNIALTTGRRFDVLDDYTMLGYEVNELATMSQQSFFKVFERTFSPLNQIALNMGFKTWRIQ